VTRRLLAAIFGLWAFGLLTATSHADERYFLLIFGSQSHPKELRRTHTWATFVRAVGEGNDPNAWTLYVHTISWLPRSLNVRVWTPFPEPGINLELGPTLDFVESQGERVTLWGPFIIAPRIYQRSLEVYQILQAGVPQYRAISSSTDLFIGDCIHAVAAVDPDFGRRHYPLIRIGNPASRYIAREVMVRSYENQGIDQAAYDNSWLIPRLGLDRRCIHVVPPHAIAQRRCLLCRCPEG
jgi:hypothetical protein